MNYDKWYHLRCNKETLDNVRLGALDNKMKKGDYVRKLLEYAKKNKIKI